MGAMLSHSFQLKAVKFITLRLFKSEGSPETGHDLAGKSVGADGGDQADQGDA